jgi:hypothetical protein
VLFRGNKVSGTGIYEIRKNLYQNISLRVPRSRQAQKKAILLALKLRRLSGHIRKKQSNSMFAPLIPKGLGEQPLWPCTGSAYLHLVLKKN